MSYNFKKIKEILGIGFVLVMVILGIYIGIYRLILIPYYLYKSPKYTVTSSVSYSGPFGHSAGYRYDFYVNNKSYNNITSMPVKEGKTYFVKFYSQNPKYSKITTIIATQKDIDSLPAGGYDKLPHK